jgi:hypothetical protein
MLHPYVIYHWISRYLTTRTTPVPASLLTNGVCPYCQTLNAHYFAKTISSNYFYRITISMISAIHRKAPCTYIRLGCARTWRQQTSLDRWGSQSSYYFESLCSLSRFNCWCERVCMFQLTIVRNVVTTFVFTCVWDQVVSWKHSAGEEIRESDTLSNFHTRRAVRGFVLDVLVYSNVVNVCLVRIIFNALGSSCLPHTKIMDAACMASQCFYTDRRRDCSVICKCRTWAI